MRPPFNDIKIKITDHTNALNELKGLAYGIQSIQLNDTEYMFVCFYDLTKERMGTTILDKFNNELRLTLDIPAELFVLFGIFTNAVLAWEQGTGQFPTDITDLYNGQAVVTNVNNRNSLVPTNESNEVHPDFKLD
jgi:hypothetical protein